MELMPLIARFDAVMSPGLDYPLCPDFPPRPTRQSIGRIETHFGIALPPALIEVALHSRSFGRWFAGLGPDYTSLDHIIRINSYCRRRRRSRAIPKYLIAFNVGFDEDFYCFDARHYNHQTGEYFIRYWSPGMEEGDPYCSVAEYLEVCVKGWETARRGRRG